MARLPAGHYKDTGQYRETILTNMGKYFMAVQIRTRWLSFWLLWRGNTTGTGQSRPVYQQACFIRTTPKDVRTVQFKPWYCATRGRGQLDDLQHGQHHSATTVVTPDSCLAFRTTPGELPKSFLIICFSVRLSAESKANPEYRHTVLSPHPYLTLLAVFCLTNNYFIFLLEHKPVT